MESLAGLAPVLRRWDLNGSQTYGLAALATAWERRAPIPGLPAARHRAGASTDAEFRDDIRDGELSREADALYFLLDRPYPTGSDDEAHRRLRAWVLLRGVHLAVSASAADGNLTQVCRALTQAADESADRKWRDFLLPLGAPADRFEDINARFLLSLEAQATKWPELFRDRTAAADEEAATSDRGRTAKGQFLGAARRLARGEPRPLNEFVPATEGVELLFHIGFAKSAGEGQLFPLRDELFSRDGDLPASVSADKRPGKKRNDIIEVDPQDTVEEQNAYVRSVRFQLGAAARFLPWDWHQLHPPEAKALHQLVSAALTNPFDSTHRLLAAVASIALLAGLSLERVAQLSIAVELISDTDWCLDLDASRLLRRPPRHEGSINLSDAHSRAVAPAAQVLLVPLAPAVREALLAARRAAPGAKQVSHLWIDRKRSLRSALLEWLRTDKNLARVQPSMLAHHAGQTTFEGTRDHVLARLISSNRSDALPASTVYAAFTTSQLATAYPQLETIPASSAPLNAAGSHLEVLSVEGLQPGFAHVLDSIQRAHRSSHWVRFHNLVVLYWDAALRAASGVRPVTKLWPSLAAFDWDLAAVYVDDKESPVSHNGRLVPLPPQLCSDFKRLYVDTHLPWVIGQIGKEHARSRSSPPGVLFTIREEDGGYMLEAIDNKFRQSLAGGVEAPLPLNYLRHRLRTELHRQTGIDLEIVDAVLGHGDGGATRTLGDFSMRRWITDAETIRPALTRLFEDIGFAPPPVWSNAQSIELMSPLPSWLRVRDVPSRDKAADERAAALSAIRKFLNDEARAGHVLPDDTALLNKEGTDNSPPDSEGLLAELSSLSEEQLDRLSWSLKSSEDGMPSVTGELRYQALLQLAGDAWDRLGRRVRLRRRYSSRHVEASPFTEQSPGAVEARTRLIEALDRRFEAVGERSRMRLSEAFGLAAFDLALVSRIANADLILDVALRDNHWRVVRLNNSFFIEWSPSDDLTEKPTAPIERFAISLRCAWLLNERIRGKGRRQIAWNDNGVAHDVAAVIRLSEPSDPAADPTATLRHVTSIVDQANAIELPGSVAAYLSQRLQAASLPWGDWIRLHHSRWHTVQDSAQAEDSLEPGSDRRQRLDVLPEDTEEDFELIRQTCYVRAEELRTKAARSSHERAAAGHELVAQVRDHIAGIEHHEDKRVHRGDVADKIALAVKNNAGEVSSAIQLLCLWAIDLLLRPGRSRKLATRSVLRYFGALSPRFTSMAYEVELDDLEGEDIEAFYRDVLDGAKAQDLSDIHDALRNFHTFAGVTAGVAEIDWSSIAVTDRIDLGSPGFIDEATYLQLLERLPAVAHAKGLVNWQLQCFAILGFRFGLRGGEIEGLRQDDLIYPGEPTRVIVRNNRIRGLKTRSARRVVPQLFELTQIEHDALRRLLESHSVDAFNVENPPLFFSPNAPAKPVDGPRLRAIINDELKACTGQPHLSIHKLRKSFAISLWMLLEAPYLPLKGIQSIEGGTRTALMERLLGTPDAGITRRSSWGVAVAMGHAHPSSALRSYLPVLADVTASLVFVTSVREQMKLEPEDVGLPALEKSLRQHIPPQPGQFDPQRRASAFDMLRALMLLGRGQLPSTTALRLELPLETVDELAHDAQAVFEKLLRGDHARLRQHVDATQPVRLALQGLLSLVHVRGHERLREGLGSITSRKPATMLGLDEVSSEHLVGMVGGRRQISMWRENHFRLTAFVARCLVKDRSRLKLEVPTNLSTNRALPRLARLTQLAASTGWLPAVDTIHRPGESPDPLCSGLATVRALPRVELDDDDGTGVRWRISLRLSPGKRDRNDKGKDDDEEHIADSLEFVVAIVCANAFARWHHARSANPSRL